VNGILLWRGGGSDGEVGPYEMRGKRKREVRGKRKLDHMKWIERMVDHVGKAKEEVGAREKLEDIGKGWEKRTFYRMGGGVGDGGGASLIVRMEQDTHEYMISENFVKG